ncbi:MAG TPA: hypothetical protein VFG90_01215 [Nitrososphaeraceae archaeon]|nr:hypothetical protein [Nitrososphaeraceae archaeon]
MPDTSTTGLVDLGIDSAHCHHKTVHWPIVLPKGLDAGPKDLVIVLPDLVIPSILFIFDGLS